MNRELPIHSELVEQVLLYLPEGVKNIAVVNNEFIEKHISEKTSIQPHSTSIGSVLGRVECLLIWNELERCAEHEAWIAQIAQTTEMIIFNCQDPQTSEWYGRLLKKLGFMPSPQVTNRIEEIKWGCKALQRSGSPKVLVSVIMPVRNTALYLLEAIESVLNQTFENIELIIVDDHSSDESRLLAREALLSDPRRKHHLLVNEGNGASAARNTGIKYAVGDYQVCFDSDDVMPIDFIATAVSTFEEGVDFVYPRQWWTLSHEKWNQLESLKTSSRKHELAFQDFSVGFRGTVFCLQDASLQMNSADYENSLATGSSLIICTMCRRSIEQKFDSKLPRLQDWDMHLELLSRNKKGRGFFSAPFIRVRPEGITGTNTRSEYVQVRSTVRRKHGWPRLSLFVAPLDSHCNFNTTQASTYLRGCCVPSCIDGATINDLEYLRRDWMNYKHFYFVCPPHPSILGWCQFLISNGRSVYFDICVAHWHPDYLYRELSNRDRLSILMQMKHAGVKFIFSTQELKDSLSLLAGTTFEGLIIPDAAVSEPKVKTDYSSSRKICWTGDAGNLPVLLTYTVELKSLLERFGYTLRIISQEPKLRIPLPWEWKEWTRDTERDLILETDTMLLPALPWGSYHCKGQAKAALAGSLGMPTVIMDINNSWVHVLADLMTSSEIRKETGLCNLRHFLSNQTTQVIASRLVQLLSASV